MYVYLLGSFFVFILLYHVLHTFFGFGIEAVSPTILSGLKDILWIILVCVGLLRNKKIVLQFLKERKGILFALLALLIWSLGLSWWQGMSVGSMIVGFKYDIFPLIVLVSALLVGYVVSSSISLKIIESKKMRRILLIILLTGLCWQGLKFLLPDLFVRFGYGPVGDYVLGTSPPIWYRTGPGGMMRLQGFFSGPNNYGFFLVGIAGLISSLVLSTGTNRKKMLLGVLYVVSLGWTISRGAWIGAGVAGALTIWWYFPKYTRYIWWGIILGVCGIVYLSILKTGSTSGHRTAFREGIQAFLAQPWGYGLGMAGPSIHYEGVYLPENQYMQILLDVGLPGFLLRGTVFFAILHKTWELLNHHDNGISKIIRLLFFGICGLCVEGLFLHVWEDSMINYLILGVFGILVGVICEQKNNREKIISI